VPPPPDTPANTNTAGRVWTPSLLSQGDIERREEDAKQHGDSDPCIFSWFGWNETAIAKSSCVVIIDRYYSRAQIEGMLFRTKDELGRTIYFPSGALGPGYIVVTEDQKQCIVRAYIRAVDVVCCRRLYCGVRRHFLWHASIHRLSITHILAAL
jgi:hypothetical protein